MAAPSDKVQTKASMDSPRHAASPRDTVLFWLAFGRPALWKLTSFTRALAHAVKFRLPPADVLGYEGWAELPELLARRSLWALVAWHRLFGLAGDVVGRSIRGPFARRFRDRLVADLRSGRSLSDVLDARPAVFPEGYRMLVRAGELSGNLERSLELAEEWTRRAFERRQARRARAIYPLAVAMVGLLVTFIVCWKVFPTFEALAVRTGHATPMAERLVAKGLRFALDLFAPCAALAIACGVALGLVSAGAPRLRRALDAALLAVGSWRSARAAFERGVAFETASLLLRARTPLQEALNLAARGFSNSEARARFADIGEVALVPRGTVLRRPPFDEATAVALSLALHSGSLPDALSLLARLSWVRARQRDRIVARILPPLLVIVLGTWVALALLSVYGTVFAVSSWMP